MRMMMMMMMMMMMIYDYSPISLPAPNLLVSFERGGVHGSQDDIPRAQSYYI